MAFGLKARQVPLGFLSQDLRMKLVGAETMKIGCEFRVEKVEPSRV